MPPNDSEFDRVFYVGDNRSVFFMTVEFVTQFCLTNLHYYEDSIVKLKCKKACDVTGISRTALNDIQKESRTQGSHSDWKTWKTWKNGKAFSSQGKVREF